MLEGDQGLDRIGGSLGHAPAQEALLSAEEEVAHASYAVLGMWSPDVESDFLGRLAEDVVPPAIRVPHP